MGKLEKIKPNAAGIDIGSEKIFVAIEGQEVKSFNTFTSTLHQAVAYFQPKTGNGNEGDKPQHNCRGHVQDAFPTYRRRYPDGNAFIKQCRKHHG